MENVQHDSDDDEHVDVRAGGKKGKGVLDVPSPEKVKEQTAARGKGVSPSRGEGIQRMLGRALLSRDLGPIP